MAAKDTAPPTSCDLEPIHKPGAVQAFGALVICSDGSLVVTHASENCFSLIGIAAHDLLGQNFLEAIGMSQDLAVFERQGCTFNSRREGGSRQFEITRSASSQAAEWSRRGQGAIDAILTQRGLDTTLAEATRQVSILTGFDRVMIYRFHEDGHGEVVAERVLEGVESYFGLHYPASDIPAQARKVFLDNWLRIIPNVAAPSLGLLSAPGAGEADLGKTLCRAVSPIHLEYLRNMNVAASMTLSLISGDRLWGLVACHHLTPKLPDENERSACETIAKVLSGLIGLEAVREETRDVSRARSLIREMKGLVGDEPNIAMAISRQNPNLLDVIAGCSAASFIDGEWVSVGIVPSTEHLDQLVLWLKGHPENSVFFTSGLSASFPPASAYSGIASGLLAISIPKTDLNYILLFRPEIVKSIRWAGNPADKCTSSLGEIRPRRSFEEWKEAVRSTSAPWLHWEVDVAHELRSAIISLDLLRLYDKERAAHAKTEEAVKAREDLMSMLSHDLKNPVGSILVNAQILETFLPDKGERSYKETVLRVKRAAESVNSLINDILHVTSLEAGTLAVEKAPEDLADIVRSVVDMLSPLAANKQLTLVATPTDFHCVARLDRGRIEQVLSNLIGNAIKFTPEGGVITAKIEPRSGGFVGVSISDTGPGIPLEHRPYIFDRFWQAKQARRMGTGLGLAISKGIVQAHGGEIWVESHPPAGSVFRFTLIM
jgi:chemotaxis family two-component system sensor kinase Cph1